MQLVDFSTLDIFDYIILGCYAAVAVFGAVQIITARVMGSNMNRYTRRSVKVYAVLSGIFYFLGGGGAVFCRLMSLDDSISYLALAGGFLLTLIAYFTVLKKQ
ncbi:MAG: hypothetical protein J1F60_01385 [Oscillospiraceae bacterium]|nr:hypothetical protein [Oscillospiraceae bacterium]